MHIYRTSHHAHSRKWNWGYSSHKNEVATVLSQLFFVLQQIFSANAFVQRSFGKILANVVTQNARGIRDDGKYAQVNHKPPNIYVV